MATPLCEVSCGVDGTLDLIENETFDFDVPFSPTDDLRDTNVEDEDEVFFGPVGHKERCAVVNNDVYDGKPMSPLNGEQIAELFKEATAVSIFIKNSSSTQIQDDINENDGKENRDICNILSKTLKGMEQDLRKSEVDTDVHVRMECASPELILQENNFQKTGYEEDETNFSPKRVLQENNSRDPKAFQSPFKGRKPRPITSVNKFASSKLPKTQMTLKTRSCFNSPIKVTHLYGLPSNSPAEKGGMKPPGVGVQPRCRRRRSSSTSSSVSSTSSVSSFQSQDLNETYTVFKEAVSGIPSITNACPRQAAPAARPSLRPASGSSGSKPMFSKPSEVPKSKGRPMPVRALPQPGVAVSSQGKTSQLPNKMQKFGSTGTPKGSRLVRPQSSSSTTQLHKRAQTPNKAGTPGTRGTLRVNETTSRQTSVSTGQQVTKPPTPSKLKKPEHPSTPRRRGSSAAGAGSLSGVPTPVRRQSRTVEGAGSGRKPLTNPNLTVKGRKTSRPSTPENGVCVTSDTVTPPNTVQSTAAGKRKSLSAKQPKRRSLLPTPLKRELTRSQSQSSRKSISNVKAAKAVPFNISQSMEVKPRTGLVAASQAMCSPSIEVLSKLRSRVSDPFSPGSTIPASPVRDSVGGDTAVRDLIDLSSTTPKAQVEEKLIDI